MDTIKDVKNPQDFSEYLRALAAVSLKAHGQVPSWLFAAKLDNNPLHRIVVPFDTTDGDSKALSLEYAAKRAVEVDADVRGHMGEVWIATYAEGDDTAPSKRSDREEAVMVVAGDGKGQLVTRQFKIVRDGDDAWLGDEVKLDEVMESGGAITDFVRGTPATRH